MTGRLFTLTSAIGLARLYEARNTTIQKSTLLEVKRTPFVQRNPTPPTMTIKRLTPAELKER
jgi:hypothetical protein